MKHWNLEKQLQHTHTHTHWTTQLFVECETNHERTSSLSFNHANRYRCCCFFSSLWQTKTYQRLTYFPNNNLIISANGIQLHYTFCCQLRTNTINIKKTLRSSSNGIHKIINGKANKNISLQITMGMHWLHWCANSSMNWIPFNRNQQIANWIHFSWN